MKKILFIIPFFFITEIIISQNDNNIFSENDFSFFYKITLNNLSLLDFKNQVKRDYLILQKQSNFNEELVFSNYFKSSKKIVRSNLNYKNYSKFFIDHCSYLEDDLRTNFKSKDLMIGNIIDNTLNNYIIKRLLLKN